MVSIPKIEVSIYSCHCIERSPSLYEYEITWKSEDEKHNLPNDAYCRRCGKGLFTNSVFDGYE